MAKFDRPVGTLASLDEIKVGERLWYVVGIWPPSASDTSYIVTRAPCQFRDHPEYSATHSGQADEIVFDTKWDDAEHSWMQFAASGNLLPGPSYNDNYWCRSHEDALAARDSLREQWDARPDLIDDAIQQRKDDAEFDAAMYQYNDDYRDEDAFLINDGCRRN